ncbi:uncharacterized protein LOC123294238 [Chrysoperla carnea]|uniref:uncharacterized protein LOC123294238 n=1 Tax=Chrysoperla carnea TaxID=189513 RepID=UPI001D07C453|nr:uncharacterized protein LOC123294238 [Chrysoperla carnea]
MLKLTPNEKPLSLKNNETVHEIYYLNQNEICVRQTRTLSGYQYDESTKTWIQKWTEIIFKTPGDDDDYSIKRYPWLITDQLLADKKILMLRHPDGVQLHELHDTGFKLLTDDDNFILSDYKYMLFGNFYDEKNSVGVMTVLNDGEVKFYIVNKESFKEDKDDPLLPLDSEDNKIELPNNWHSKTTQFYVAKFQNQDVVALKTISDELEFYQLTTEPKIKQLLKTTQIKGVKDSDRLFFVNLTNQKFQDIVTLTQNGLQVYQYDANSEDYKLLGNDVGFTSDHGWTSLFSKSIHFMDVNNDQKDELIYTGKDGLTVITFDVTSRKWKELIKPLSINRIQRYGQMIPILNPNVAKNPIVFTKSADGSVQWAQVLPAEQVIPTSTTVAPDITTPPSITTETKLPVQLRKELREKPILRLAEYIDEDFIKKAIDIGNGQVDFNIPLVDTVELSGIPLKLPLKYNSQVVSSGEVGIGWSFPIGKDFIYVDYQGSIFLEDAIFFLVIEGQKVRLDLKSDTDDSILKFEPSQEIADEEITIEYNKSTETWILNGKTYRRVYGKANTENAKDCLRWSLSYPNWRDAGTSDKGFEPIVISWYLNEHIDKKRNRTLFYDYMIDNKLFGDNSYSSAIFLTTIRSDANFKLTLNYEKKTKDEYTISNPKNDDGKIEFPVLLREDRYLTKYTIQADNYQQSIRFQYKLNDKKRLLTNVLNTFVLSEITLARGSVMQFKYNSNSVLPEIPRDRENVRTYRTNSENIKFSYSNDYAVMAYNTDSYVHLTILNPELTTEIESLTCPGTKIKNYESLNVFKYKDEKWMRDATRYQFDKSVSIQFGDVLIVASDIKRQKINLFDTKSKKWKGPKVITDLPFKALAVHKKYVVMYDDNHIWIMYNKSDKWHREKLHHLPGLYTQTQETIERFDVKSDTQEKFIKDFTESCFKIMKNIIILNALQITNNDQLTAKLHLLTINANLKVADVKTYEFKREHILDLSYKLDDQNKTSKFHLKYGENNGKYRLKVYDFSGEMMDEYKKEYKNKNKLKDAVDEQIKKLNEAKGFQKVLYEQYLVNWQSLLVHATYQFIQHGINDTIQMTGTGWEEKKLDEDFTIDLGPNFRITSVDDERKNFTMYKNGEAVKEFKLYMAGLMVNRFPMYLAYQPREHDVNIIVFKENGKEIDQEICFEKEGLIKESNYQNLITRANTTLVEKNIEPHECLIRPIATLISQKKQYYVKESILNLGEFERKIVYRQSYKFDSKKSIYTQTITMIPTGNKTNAGWSEINYSKNVHKGTVTKTHYWYNLNDIKVEESEEVIQEDRQEKQKKENPLNSTLLMDRNEKLVICDLRPYNLADEMISYYGFESYETNKYWKFNQKNVVENLNAFTGQNYLVINSGSRLEGTLKPQDQHITYLVSCWLRAANVLKLNEATSILKMNLRTSEGENIFTSLGQVKQQSNDWYYLELIIDFETIKQMYKNYIDYYKNKTLPALNDVKFEITVIIESDSTIDLDHIRFSPLTHDFEANVYDPKVGVPIATIHETGLVTRSIYNNMYKKIATINQDGEIVELISSSETGRLFPTPQGVQFKNPYPSYLTFVPEQSSYETFARGWETKTPKAWHIASPGQLSHLDNEESHQLKAVNQIDTNSVTLRFFMALLDTNSYVALSVGTLGQLKLTKDGNFSTMILPNKHKISSLPQSGEIIIMVEENFVTIWFDGVLIVDESFEKVLPAQTLVLEAHGEILIEDFMILNRPHLQVDYLNELGEKVQEIKYETPQSVLVTQMLYDALGRNAITSKTTRLQRQNNQSPLLIYHKNFVTNINPKDSNSVWHTNRLDGKIHELNPADKGAAFIRTEYWDNPLNDEKKLGLPGPEYSTSGAYVTSIAKHSNHSFMDNLFPKKLGYTQNVQISSNGAETVTVYDQQRNKIAIYVNVPGFDHLLSTYEYNGSGKLTKILPPVYHEKVGTELKTTAYQPDKLTKEEKNWQEMLATTLTYNEHGQVLRKNTPDFGPIDNLYDSNNKLRFMITSVKESNSLEKPQTVYFDHNNLDQLIATGFFNQTLGIEELKKYTESVFLPNTEKFQQLDYSDYHPDPQLRGRIKHCITYNDDGETILEKLRFDSDEQMVERKILSVMNDIQLDIKKQYKNGKIQRLSYPNVNNKSLDLDFTYNRLGQLIELKTPNLFTAKFTYDSTGDLASESFQSSMNSLTRKYSYNSPGFLTQITDPFMTETMTYTEKGYGHAGYGDGIIMETHFTNNWTKNADMRWFQINEDSIASFTNDSKLCLNALKKYGYLDNQNKPIKLYIIDAEPSMPLLCGMGKIADLLSTVIAQNYVPQTYGYKFSYGNHQELIKAKYYTDEISKLIDPLQIDSFAKFIPEISSEQSEKIWELLTEAKYILKDQPRHHSKTAIGKRGKSFFRDEELKSDLKSLNENYMLYLESIKQFIIKHQFDQQKANVDDFTEALLRWEGAEKSSLLIYNKYKDIGNEIGKMLKNKEYFSTKSLHNNFGQILSQFSKYIPKIVSILWDHFTYGLGGTPFDHESYEIDGNGNHKFFVSNFDKYKINYQNHTNKIDKIEISKIPYEIEHDASGNIIKAKHKGIESIKYHPVTQRATSIQMTNGLTLRFYYDAAGERILKKVFNADGKLQYEVRYVRDTEGRVLIDQRKKYLGLQSTEETLTYYFYGPRGLVGYIRDDNYYHVLTDHAGSIRLIIRAIDNEVITAFDYLPYGKLMRAFGDKTFIYRYTGQEWDEETGLYNYHARLYDPSIGRFYQPDPKSQYFSPYVYAGNSPISTIDPDGEFALIITCIVLGIIGAYLGAAKLNNRWNPADWDWKDLGTYKGLGIGFLVGVTLPLTFKGSWAVFGGLLASKIGSLALGISIHIALALTGSYIMMAVENGGNFNPKKWDWSKPATYYGMLDGVGLLLGLFGGVGSLHKYAGEKLINLGGRLTRTQFLILSYSTAIGVAYAHGVIANDYKYAFWEWDWKNANTYLSLISGFSFGSGIPQNINNMHRGFLKWRENSRSLTQLSSSKRQMIKAILKNPKHPLYKVTASIVMGYYRAAAANGNNFDFTKWRFDTFATYEGILKGIFDGKKYVAYAEQGITLVRENIHKISPNRLINKYIDKNMRRIFDYIEKVRKTSKFYNLVEKNFQNPDKELISKLSDALKQDVEKFLKEGYKKWKNGETRIPKPFEEKLREQVNKQFPPRALKDFQKEEDAIDRQQQQITTDRLLDFLSCRRESVTRENIVSIVCRPSTTLKSDVNTNIAKMNAKFETNLNSDRKQPRIDRSIPDAHTNSSINTITTEFIDTAEFLPQYVRSKGTRLEFWPLNLAKKAGTVAVSLLASWTNYDNKPSENPTLLEMGDNWVQNADTNGLLTWGIYFANKLTGYRPKPIPLDQFDEMANTELQIRSTIIVDRFMDTLLEFVAETNNSKTHEMFENTVTYCEAIKNVRQKLSVGDIQGIPDMLFKLLVKNNMEKFMSVELFSKMTNDNTMSEFLEFINQQEHEWLSRKQSPAKLSDYNNKYQRPQQVPQHCFLPKNFPNVECPNSLFIDQVIDN